MTTAMTMVGIGASAGGLEALQGLFGAMPADSGMAFVVVTHLAPGRKSAMAEILARATRMPVSDAQDGTVVQPDDVYLIPPDRIARALLRVLGWAAAIGSHAFRDMSRMIGAAGA